MTLAEENLRLLLWGEKALTDPNIEAPEAFQLMREAFESNIRFMTRIVDGQGAPPTPEAIRIWAEWFDDPKNPGFSLYCSGKMTPGMLLRRIAEGLEMSYGF